MFDSILLQLRPWEPVVIEPLLELAVEIAREGREGRRIGTIFTIGDEQAVLQRSRPLILDPLACHARELRRIADHNLRGTVKELAQLDGAFIVASDGVVEAACRYLDASAAGATVRLGLGSRHVAAAGITRMTQAAAIVVSETAVVRVFRAGEIVAEILPELWLLSRHTIQVAGPLTEERVRDLAVFTPRGHEKATQGHE